LEEEDDFSDHNYESIHEQFIDQDKNKDERLLDHNPMDELNERDNDLDD